MALRIQCTCIDARDPAAQGRFWADVLGWRITHEEDDEVVLEPPAGSPEDGVVPDLDLRPDDRDAEVARIEALGATRVDVGQGPDVTWVVLADPEGNELCVLRPLTPEELAEG
jgi:predicted enzyme related to lactoylglutathione lyase